MKAGERCWRLPFSDEAIEPVVRLFKILLPLTLLAGSIAIFASLKATRPEPKSAEIRERIWRVEVETVRPDRLAPELTLYGRVETPDLLKVAAPAAARVLEVLVRDGERVAAGDLLVRLDERDFKPRLRQAQSEVTELKALIESERNRHDNDVKALEQEQKLLEIAGDGVDRAKRLRTQRVGSEADLDQAEQELARQALTLNNREMSIADFAARIDALKARLQRASAGLETIQLQYDRSVIRAPYDGVVSVVDVTAGDQVKADTVLLRLYSVRSLEVRARIAAPYQGEILAALEQGLPLTAEVDIGAGKVQLVLERLAGEASASGVDGLFAVQGDPVGLRLGQMVQLRLRRPVGDDLVPVPYEAVYGDNRVYRLDDNRMHALAVEVLGGMVGQDGSERLLVRSPLLHAGDRIVVTHMPNAIEGLRVEAVQ